MPGEFAHVLKRAERRLLQKAEQPTAAEKAPVAEPVASAPAPAEDASLPSVRASERLTRLHALRRERKREPHGCPVRHERLAASGFYRCPACRSVVAAQS